MRSLLVAAALATASGKILKSENAELIENEFIVVLRENTTKADRDSHIALLGDATVLHTYENVFNGYAVRASEHVIERLSEHPDVLYVEQNGAVHALQTCLAGPANPPAGLWGLSRVSFQAIQNPIQSVRYSSTVGADVYVLDTGINYAHNDFGGRATFVFDSTGEGQGDGNGHGTHCSGTAAGGIHGISKNSRLFDVKVLNRQGSGTFAGVTAGIDFVAGRGSAPNNRVVASMSLGGGTNTPTNDAVNRLFNTGAIISVASGNSNANACNSSPAGAALAFTVNSITTGDVRSTWSNWGTCTDIFAPGQNVLSAWIGSATATNTISGTSMACPHVTGIAADLWGRNPTWTNAQIQGQIRSSALPNLVVNPGTGSPNLIAQAACRV